MREPHTVTVFLEDMLDPTECVPRARPFRRYGFQMGQDPRASVISPEADG